MTAEIIVMNKQAIALAADSVLTLGGSKTYDSANKLFTLSKYHPVGIMVYGNGEFGSIPWETIIKLYRTRLADRHFNSIGEYAEDFVNYLKQTPIFQTSEEVADYHIVVYSYFKSIRKEIDDAVKDAIDCAVDKGQGITDKDVKKIIFSIISKHHSVWKQLDNLSCYYDGLVQNLLNNHRDKIIEIKNEVFPKLPLTRTINKKLLDIATFIVYKDNFSPRYSGVVIAGFGNEEIFPSYISMKMDLIINDVLKYKIESETKIDFDNPSVIEAFAQSEMVYTFMEGIDPLYRIQIFKLFSGIVHQYPDALIDAFFSNDNKQKKEMLNKLHTIGDQVFNDFMEVMKEYQYQCNVEPIVRAVAGLPKAELPAMAESLVYLTSLKRKISMETETVGGPIDVALISKGDGFIWIKHKHYFEPELNHQFFSNYFIKQK